jgi:hypothetical protein
MNESMRAGAPARQALAVRPAVRARGENASYQAGGALKRRVGLDGARGEILKSPWLTFD